MMALCPILSSLPWQPLAWCINVARWRFGDAFNDISRGHLDSAVKPTAPADERSSPSINIFGRTTIQLHARS